MKTTPFPIKLNPANPLIKQAKTNATQNKYTNTHTYSYQQEKWIEIFMKVCFTFSLEQNVLLACVSLMVLVRTLLCVRITTSDFNYHFLSCKHQFSCEFTSSAEFHQRREYHSSYGRILFFFPWLFLSSFGRPKHHSSLVDQKKYVDDGTFSLVNGHQTLTNQISFFG